jgi:hypothetical protein
MRNVGKMDCEFIKSGLTKTIKYDKNKIMKNKFLIMVGFMAILSVNINSQNYNNEILNEHWVNEGYPHIIYTHFDYYSFFDDGTFVNNYGVYNSGTFLDVTIHGKYIKKNNIIELEVIDKKIHGFYFLSRQNKSDTFIIEIIDINENILKIKYSNDEIIVMNRYSRKEINNIISHREMGILNYYRNRE